MDPSFWDSKRVFVTGHTGFKGSWLCLLLHNLKATIIGYSRSPPTIPNLFELANIEKYLEKSIIGDVRDLNHLKKAVLQAEPDIIFHLAAQPLVRYSYTHPVQTYETNVLGTVNILESMRGVKTTKVFINVTTDKCYENKDQQQNYRETDALGGYDPYSNSKACSELVTAAYRSSYFNSKHNRKALATVRAGNVIGGGDWSCDRLIPDIITAFQKGTKPIIRYPNAVRPWQYVLEPLCGYLTLAEKLWEEPSQFAESWNFGPKNTDCKPVSWIANAIIGQLDKSFNWELNEIDRTHESQWLTLDISKAESRLKWKPQWNIYQALEATVSWYQNWFKQKNILDFTLNQINEYSKHWEKANA